jgi:hypothetical protein
MGFGPSLAFSYFLTLVKRGMIMAEKSDKLRVPGLPSLTPVRSSTVDEIGWKDEQLFVRFLVAGTDKGNGPIYRYDGVPEAKFRKLVTARSKGKYLGKHIKGKFHYAKWSGRGWIKETRLQVAAARKRNAGR